MEVWVEVTVGAGGLVVVKVGLGAMVSVGGIWVDCVVGVYSSETDSGLVVDWFSSELNPVVEFGKDWQATSKNIRPDSNQSRFTWKTA